MKELIRLLYIEFYKMRHTGFFLIHLLAPVFGIFIFLWYYKVTPHKWETEVSAYLTVLATSLPLVISVVCAQAVSPEEGNHFLVFLGVAVKRRNAFLAKWWMVFLSGLGAMTLAVGGFMAGYCLLLKRMPFDMAFCLAVIFIMWNGSFGLYVIHMILNLWKPRSLSICAGAAESVVSALMLTGLGDGLWQLLPCAYAGRWEWHFFRYYLEGKLPLEESVLRASFGVNAVILAGITGAAMTGFYYYEGRRVND